MKTQVHNYENAQQLMLDFDDVLVDGGRGSFATQKVADPKSHFGGLRVSDASRKATTHPAGHVYGSFGFEGGGIYCTSLKQARKSIEPKDFRDINRRALSAASDLRKKEAELIRILQEVDAYKVYRYLGLQSLYQYCLKALKLSEAQSCNYITVARKAREFPGLLKAIEDQQISVCKARKITPVLERGNQQLWLQRAKTLSKYQLEKEVAKVSPRTIRPESARFLNDHTLELQLPVEERVYKKLKRVQDLMSQKSQRPTSLEEALEALCDLYIKKHDPIEKAKRVKAHAAQKKSQTASSKSLEKRKNQKSKTQVRQKIPVAILHQVHLRDQGQCTYRDSVGKRCEQRRWLEIHHIQPLHLGGSHRLENLTTLCSGHHKVVHQKQRLGSNQA